MSTIASQITSLTIVYSTVYSGADQSKHQSSASLAFVWGIHRGPVNSPHKWPVTRKMFPFDDVIMTIVMWCYLRHVTMWLHDALIKILSTTNSPCLATVIGTAEFSLICSLKDFMELLDLALHPSYIWKKLPQHHCRGAWQMWGRSYNSKLTSCVFEIS